MKTDTDLFAAYLQKTFPDAHCSLHFSSPYEAVVAVMLSAQTSDESVNKVTPALFRDYPNAQALSKASVADIENHIKSLGLYHNKAKHLQGLAKALVENYEGEVPSSFEAMVQLPGVGVKTANVVLAECFSRPSIPVDTHVGRVAKRMGYAKKSDEPVVVEAKLEKLFPVEEWIPLHHRIIAFGRGVCHAQNPECERCGLSACCPYKAKISRIADK